MNHELEETINQIIKTLSDTTITDLPILVDEIISFTILKYSFSSLLTLLPLAITIKTAINCVKLYKLKQSDPEQHEQLTEEGTVFFNYAATFCGLGITVYVFLLNISPLLKASFFPRLFLIEYMRSSF